MIDGFDRKTLAAGPGRFTYRCIGRFQDVDAAGYLFFARMFDYFHDAWLAYLEHAGIDHPERVTARDWGIPLKHVEADYLTPVRYGDRLEIQIVRVAWHGSNLTVGYRAMLPGDRVAAVGVTQHVVLAMATMTRIEPPPASLVQAFRALEGG